jgi:hypothetical protein
VQRLAERTDAFTIITEYVFCYMKGMLENANAAVYTKNNRPLPPVYASMECYMSAARMYKPSEALVRLQKGSGQSIGRTARLHSARALYTWLCYRDITHES